MITFFLVPLIKKVGLYYNILDYPDYRKNHKIPIVRIGGLAIIISWLFTLFIIFHINPFKSQFFNQIPPYSLGEITISAVLFFLIGFTDDIKRLSPYLRLFLQFGVASICWGMGLSIDYLNLSFLFVNIQPILLPVFLSYILTIFYIVSIVNAVNWWDGLDGLSTGTTIISLFFLIIINLSFFEGDVSRDSLLIANLLGTLIAFLIYNYKPADILMGDGGSYFLGFSLAYLTLLNNFSNSFPNNIYLQQKSNILLPILVVLPLLIDMFKVILLRLLSSKLLFKADRLHIHHNLLEFGLNDIEVVHQLYAVVLLVSSLSLLFLDLKLKSIYFLIISLVFCLITFINLRKKFKFNKNSISLKN